MEQVVTSEESRRLHSAYLTLKVVGPACGNDAAHIIDGFESPLGMELLAMVDWLIARERCEAGLPSIREGLGRWPAGSEAAERKLRLFNDRLIGLALDRLTAQ